MSIVNAIKRLKYSEVKFKGWYLFLPLLLVWLFSLYYIGAGHTDPKYVYEGAPVLEQTFDFSKASNVAEVEAIYQGFYKQFMPLGVETPETLPTPRFLNQVSLEAMDFHKVVVENALLALERLDSKGETEIFKTLKARQALLADPQGAFKQDPTLGTQTLMVPYIEGGFEINSKEDIEAYFLFLKDGARLYKELAVRVKAEMARPENLEGMTLADLPENRDLQKKTMALMDAMEMSLGVFESKLKGFSLSEEERRVYFDRLIMVIGGELYTNVRDLHDLYMEIDRHAKFE